MPFNNRLYKLVAAKSRTYMKNLGVAEKSILKVYNIYCSVYSPNYHSVEGPPDAFT